MVKGSPAAASVNTLQRHQAGLKTQPANPRITLTTSSNLQCTAATNDSSDGGHRGRSGGPPPGAAGCNSSAARAASEGMRNWSFGPKTCQARWATAKMETSSE